MNKHEKYGKKYIKLNQKRTMEQFLFSKKITIIYIKKTKKSKYLKISLILFFKHGFARLGSVLHIFLDRRKLKKKISKKKSKNLKQISKSFKFAGKKQTNQIN
jgi:hypothetical protein